MGYFIRGTKFPSFSSSRRKDSLKPSEKVSLLEGELVVPKGFLAVYVGEEMRRFVIPMSFLCHPAFKELMESVAEEFGYKHEGGLRIPCEEAFEETLKIFEETRKKKKRKEKKERSH